jgi:hypothetical protein
MSAAQRDDIIDEAEAYRLGFLWIARDDARNYVILGDPAVRIRAEALA